jgi:hypothetical protein
VEWAEESHDRRGILRFYAMEHLWQIGLVEELSTINISVYSIKEIMRWVSSTFIEERDTRLGYWKYCTFVLWRYRPGLRGNSDSIKKTGMFSSFNRGRDWNSVLVSSDIREDLIKAIFSDSLSIVMINLNSIVLKVEEFLKRAAM